MVNPPFCVCSKAKSCHPAVCTVTSLEKLLQTSYLLFYFLLYNKRFSKSASCLQDLYKVLEKQNAFSSMSPCRFLAFFWQILHFYAPAYSKNSGRALSVTPVRPVRPSVRPSVRTSHFRVRAITTKPYGIYSWNFTGAYITIRRCVMNKEDNSRIFGFWIISPWLNSI